MNPSASDFRRWEIPGVVTFSDTPGGLVRIDITTALSKAEVYLQGAHVTLFQPAGSGPLLFLSARSHFSPGKPIRGGVPVIFPWFGPHPSNAKLPAHGFARTLPWEVESLACDDGATVHLVLALAAGDATRLLWPHDFILRHHIVIGAQLGMALEVTNTSAQPFSFEEALHTYLAVSDVRQVAVTGLGETPYLDKVDAARLKLQDAAPIRITGETDRVYLNTRTTCTVADPGMGRSIHVEKSGSETTVLWNPWTAKAAAMADFGDDEWPGMICIETANAAENAVTLAPGASHTMRATVRGT